MLDRLLRPRRGRRPKPKQKSTPSPPEIASRADSQPRRSPRDYSFLTVEEVLALPDPTWIVEGAIPADSIAQIYGPTKTGKTFVALDLALSISSGRPWAGSEVSQGSVIYIASESVAGYKKRIAAWQEHYGVAAEDLANFRLVNDAVRLGEDAAVRRFIERAKAEFRDRPISLIVFDTQARCTSGIEENSNTEMGRVIDQLERVRHETGGATPLLIHHTGREGPGDRGASAVPSALTLQIEQTMLGDRVVRLRCVKQKDWDEFSDLKFQLREVGDSLVSVFAEVGSPAGREIEEGTLTPKQRTTLQVLRDGFAGGATHGEWKEAALGADVSSGTFGTSIRLLQSRGLVRHEDDLYVPVSPESSESSPEQSRSRGASSEEVQKSTHPLGGGLLDSDAREASGGPTVDQRVEDAWEESRDG